MARFKSEKELAKIHPYFISIFSEVKVDYPDAKLVAASDRSFPNEQIDIHMVYDIGSPDSYLWVWASNYLHAKNSFVIDEYFEIPKEKALSSLDNSW